MFIRMLYSHVMSMHMYGVNAKGEVVVDNKSDARI